MFPLSARIFVAAALAAGVSAAQAQAPSLGSDLIFTT